MYPFELSPLALEVEVVGAWYVRGFTPKGGKGGQTSVVRPTRFTMDAENAGCFVHGLGMA